MLSTFREDVFAEAALKIRNGKPIKILSSKDYTMKASIKINYKSLLKI